MLKSNLQYGTGNPPGYNFIAGTKDMAKLEYIFSVKGVVKTEVDLGHCQPLCYKKNRWD